jgi:hypothetical protein
MTLADAAYGSPELGGNRTVRTMPQASQAEQPDRASVAAFRLSPCYNASRSDSTHQYREIRFDRAVRTFANRLDVSISGLGE